ncbi:MULTISPECIES: transposase [unclassified Neorhizobium]|uniref:transposase n=1 Tax=unclassified Neorhizobium TaxID=2629175 RepID=UPI001FF62418|nr:MULTISPECIES: transposase [unclassified Neorhizobium]MCJ9668976.1 transposase [Neorhizobium sp. SHOUNA12B]MCJ9744930.1 transposase [Neorhizobium sp. SHOUNA12A]
MRCGFPSLALRVQEVLKHEPLSGRLLVFRGRRSDILKIIWHDGLGLSVYPTAGERSVHLAERGGRLVVRQEINKPPLVDMEDWLRRERGGSVAILPRDRTYQLGGERDFSTFPLRVDVMTAVRFGRYD